MIHSYTKKNIFVILPEKEPELKSYIKTQKLSLRENSDSIELIQYYNTL
jgi:hypothetical protein